MKRTFDFFFSLLGLIVLAPILFLTFIFVKVSSKGHGFYVQSRVGRNNTDFDIVKFRTMNEGASKFGLLTIGDKDPRITRIGYYLRKFKLDELPQLINVIKGDMSFVGPRPELRKYVNLYTKEQLKVLDVRPGITDLASIVYRNESQILAQQECPERYYRDVILLSKISINLKYLENRNLIKDFLVIFKTIKAVLLN
mgnify:CR=1 FL=1